MKEYLVKDKTGRWEICHPAVFKVEEGRTLAWANRQGEWFESNDDAIEVRDLPG